MDSPWSYHWRNPGNFPGSSVPQNPSFNSVTTSSFTDKGPFDLQGDILYKTQAWITFTVSPAVVLFGAYGNTTLTSNTLVGKYRRLGSSLVLLNIRGNVVFSAGTGAALLQVNLPPLLSSQSFSLRGSFIGTSSGTLTFSVPISGFAAAGATTALINPAPLAAPGATVTQGSGFNNYQPSGGGPITINVEAFYETTTP